MNLFERQIKIKLTRILKIIFVFVLFYQTGCSGLLFFNKQPKDNRLKLAIIPIHGEFPLEPDKIDKAFVLMFEDTRQIQILIPPDIIRAKLNSDSKLSDITWIIVTKNYSEQEQKSGPNLINLIKEDGLEYLKQSLFNADVLLVPVKFNIELKNNTILGHAECRLYDLNTGSLIYDKKQDLSIENDNENSAKKLVILLISGILYDYNNDFLDKQILTK